MKHNRDKTRCAPSGRRRLEFGAPKVQLPLLNKAVYMDVKNSKQANFMEEQLKKLGARVEKFLSREVNYVISSSGPPKAVDRASNHEENPQSPSFVASPFNSGPSPTGQLPSEAKSAAMVSRGKALAQIACAKNKASTVVTSAEKLGIKVISADVAVKWLEKEMKKIKCTKEDIMKETKMLKEEVSQKENKYKKKLLKGSFIKFEDNSRQYRPVKLELDKWPRLNLSAPPGICPFGESKVKVQHQFGPRAQQSQTNGAAASHMGDGVVTQNVSRLEQEVPRPAEQKMIVPDLVGVPLVPTADNRCILNFNNKKNVFLNKQQGYCDCCCVKFQNMREHVAGEQHRSFARQKSNYERLDGVIGQIQSTASFLQSVLVKHCIQKQTTPTTTSSENFSLPKSLSPSKTGRLDQQHEPVIQSIKTPDPSGQDVFTTKDYLANTENTECMAKQDGSLNQKETTNVRPPAVVIRRPQPSGLFVSPSRRQPTPSKKPWIQERSMIFRDSPMASLQPSPSCGSQNVSGFLSDSNLDVTYNKVAMSGHSMRRLVNIFDARKTKQNVEIGEIRNAFSTLFSKRGEHLSSSIEPTYLAERVEGCEKQLLERSINSNSDEHRSLISEQKDGCVKKVFEDAAAELKNKNIVGLKADLNVTGVHKSHLELPSNRLHDKLATNEKTQKLPDKLNCFVLLRDACSSSKKSNFSKNYVDVDSCLGSASATSQSTGAEFFRHKSKTADKSPSENNDKTVRNLARSEKLHRVCNQKSPAIKTNLEAVLEPPCTRSRIIRFGGSGGKDSQVDTPSNSRVSRVERRRVTGRVTRESVKKCLFQEAAQPSHLDKSVSRSQELKLRNEFETFNQLSVAGSNLESGDGGGSVDSKDFVVVHKNRTFSCKEIESIQKNKCKDIVGDVTWYNSCAISQSNSVEGATEAVQVKSLAGCGTNSSAISSAGKGVLEDIVVNVSPSVNTCLQMSRQDSLTNSKEVQEEVSTGKYVTHETAEKTFFENIDISMSPCVNRSVKITDPNYMINATDIEREVSTINNEASQNEEKSVLVDIEEGILSYVNMCVPVLQADPAKEIRQISSTVDSETTGTAKQSIFENLEMCDLTNANSIVHTPQPDILINKTGCLQENSRANCEVESAGLAAEKSALGDIDEGVSSVANTCPKLVTGSGDLVRSTREAMQLTNCGSHERNNAACAAAETESCEELGVNASEDLNTNVKISAADSTLKPAEVGKIISGVDCDSCHTGCVVAEKESVRDPVCSCSDNSVQMPPSDLTMDAALVVTEAAEAMMKTAGTIHITTKDNHELSLQTALPVHKDKLEEVHVNVCSDSNTSGNILPSDLMMNTKEAVQVSLYVQSGAIQASTAAAEDGFLPVDVDAALDLNTSHKISPPVDVNTTLDHVNTTLDLNINFKIKHQNSSIEKAETLQDSHSPVASPATSAVVEDLFEDVVSVSSDANAAVQTKQISVIGTTELLQVTGVVNQDEGGAKDLKMDSCRNEVTPCANFRVEICGGNKDMNKSDILSFENCNDNPEVKTIDNLVINTAMSTNDTKDGQSILGNNHGNIRGALIGEIRWDNEVKNSGNIEHCGELKTIDNLQTECLSQSNEVKITDSLDYQICKDKNEVNTTILYREIGSESIEVTAVDCVSSSTSDINKSKSTDVSGGLITSENNIGKIMDSEDVQAFSKTKEVKTFWCQTVNENNVDANDVWNAHMPSVDKNKAEPRDTLSGEVCVAIQDSNIDKPVDVELLVSKKYLEIVVPEHMLTESSEATRAISLPCDDVSLSQVLDCAANKPNVDHILPDVDVGMFTAEENSLEHVNLESGNAEANEVTHFESLPYNDASLNQVLSSAAYNLISDRNLPLNAVNDELSSKAVLQTNQGGNQEDVDFEEKFDLSFLNLRKTAEVENSDEETEFYGSDDTIIYGLNVDEKLFDEVLTMGEVGKNALLGSAEDSSCMRVPDALIQETQLRPDLDSLLEDLKQEISSDVIMAVAGNISTGKFGECRNLMVPGHSTGSGECIGSTHVSDQEVVFPAVKDEQWEDFYNLNLGVLARPKEECFAPDGIDSFNVNEHNCFTSGSTEGERLPSLGEDGLELIVVPNIADRVKSRSRITSSPSQPIISDSKTEKDVNKRKAKKRRRMVHFNHHLSTVKLEGVDFKKTWVNNTGLIAARRRDRSIAVNRHNRSIAARRKNQSIAIKEHNRAIAAKRKNRSVHSVKLGENQANQSPDVLTVSNIAENVKKRRSCTMFNHKGQYANDGEGAEGEMLNEVSIDLSGLRTRAKINSQSTEKGIIKTVNSIMDYDSTTKRSGSTDSDTRVKGKAIQLASTDCSSSSLIKLETESTPKMAQALRTEDELSDTSTAVVIRRRKSAIFPETLSSRSRKPEVDWSLCQDEEDPISQSGSIGDKTMTQLASCEKNPTTPSPANPSMFNSLIRKLSQPHQQNTDSEILSTALTDFVTNMGDTDIVKLVTKRSSKWSPRLSEKAFPFASSGDSPLAKYSVSSPGLGKGSVMSPGVRRCLGSSPGLSCSPRLRLKIKKEPDDRGYSSTLEEIHNCVCRNGVLSKDSCQSFDRQKNAENHIRVFHTEEYQGEQVTASVCSLTTDGCQHHPTNHMFSSPDRSRFGKQTQHFSTPDNSDAVLFLESPIEIKTPEQRIRRRTEKADKYISDSPASSKRMLGNLNLSPVFHDQSPLFTKFLPTLESDSSDATILQPPSPCFSSPISNFVKFGSTPRKSRVRDGSPPKCQSPVFSLTRKNLKLLQNTQGTPPVLQNTQGVPPCLKNTQCSPSRLQNTQHTKPSLPLDVTCTDSQLPLPTLQMAGLEATVRVAKLTPSLPVFNNSSNGVSPSKQSHHHKDRKLPSAKRIKTENSSNSTHFGPPTSLHSPPGPAITTHVSSESNFSNLRLSGASELLPVICDTVLPSALTYNSTTEGRSKRATNNSNQHNYMLDHEAADWSETKLKDQINIPRRPWTDTSGSCVTDSGQDSHNRRSSHSSSKGGQSTSNSCLLSASGQSVSRPNKRSFCVEVETAAEVNILSNQKRRKTESGVSTCVR